ncbi:MAG: cell envelope integrity protein TolA [Chlorobiaceae bacterium]|nr:cell envelope integrity protein TolA [Chlorobiaceae bacterium]NTW74235.1 cell envelope integrity protein TolA [Chlorobiaceae bacterium]
MSSRDRLRSERNRFLVWVGVAAAAHVLLAATVIFMQSYWAQTHPPLKVVSVSLVTLPGAPGPVGGSAASEPSPAPETPAPKAPEPPAVKKAPEPAIAKKTVPAENPRETKKSLDDALAKLKKSTESKQSSQGISSALANLQKKVASQGSGPAHGSGSGGGGGLYGQGGGASDPYKSKIAGIIMDNWTFSQQMVRNARGMEVYVAINILPNGTISQIRYDRRAPSEYLNNSVKTALQKSNPLPPVPREYGSKGLWVGFVFTPEGIEQ